LFHRYLATVGRDAPGGIARLRADDGVALRHGWGGRRVLFRGHRRGVCDPISPCSNNGR
jgi:hypothetical protein